MRVMIKNNAFLVAKYVNSNFCGWDSQHYPLCVKQPSERKAAIGSLRSKFRQF